MSTGPIPFTGNYQDLSTDLGYQFKFFCERCQNGYMSSYDRNEVGTAGELLRGASNLLGGLLGGAANASYNIERMVGGPAHDAALRAAVKEISPLFKQCHHCGNWRCEQVCWNGHAGMCKDCAPISEDVETSERARFVQQQVQGEMQLEEQARLAAKQKTIEAACANCGSATGGKKFCPECGTPTKTGPAFCGECGAKGEPGAKFCAECGAKMGG